MRCLTQIFASLLLLSLLGCTQRFQDTSDTVKEGLFGFDDVVMTKQQVDQLPYASMYVRVNDGPRVFMVLGFADTDPTTGRQQLKWLSADKAMIVTENGRIVKTLRLLNENLAGISSADPWPDFQQTAPFQWQLSYDWQPNYRFGYAAQITTEPVGEETLTSLLWQQPTTIWREQIQFSSLDQQMQNQFWVTRSGQVVKSIQWLSPQGTRIETELLKPYDDLE
ncbi:YjbF family lipoprotein [Vibrio sp.]|uniref:YjbF family lipoprotein n=1 Tax=Vibrio sp. TaxID=678 RepID=UPI003D0F031D